MPLDEERGGDNTIEVYSAINILTDAEGGFLKISVAYAIYWGDNFFSCREYVWSFLLLCALIAFIVEACLKQLACLESRPFSVDWLTEVIRRYSEAVLVAKSLAQVDMKGFMRLEMVCLDSMIR
jgi:hypothetical protein